MAILNNNPLIGSGGNQGYNINNSLRFRSSASAYLSRTPSSAGNRKTWTWSAWVKRGQLGTFQTLFCAGPSDAVSPFETRFRFNDTDTLALTINGNGATGGSATTTAVFRDPSAWYHIVAYVDMAASGQANKVRIYVNNVLQTVTYSLLSTTDDTQVNNNVIHRINANSFALSGFADNYLAEVNLIDGQALTPSSFGETDTTTGVWKPKAYSGTYGTNGFYLKFSDIATTSGSNAGLGKDFSGNSNYWTTNNISVTSGTTYDAMTDSPTNTSATVANYCVFSPLWTGSPTLSNGNLQITSATTSQTAIGSMAVNSGKFYFEYQYTSSPATNGGGGVWDINSAFSAGGVPDSGTGARYVPTSGNIFKFINGSSTTVGTYATYTSGDVIGVGFDCDAGTVSFYKNNTLQVTITDSNFISKFFAPLMYVYIGNVAANFGQRPFAYTPPTGYVALNTYNLPTPTILQGNKYMDATLYTGTGATLAVTNAGAFKPDFVWIKDRTAIKSNTLYNSSSGVEKVLLSNTTDAEATVSGSLTAFNSNGFSLGTSTYSNVNADNFVAWQWQAGQGSTSSNTSGSITSTVSVNTTAGFSIVTYTGIGGNVVRTFGHGLGVAPKMVIVKDRVLGTTGTDNWVVYHASATAAGFLLLNTTAAYSANANYWGNTTPTSSVVSVGGNASNVSNESGVTYVGYCWAEIAGFSKFGSYTGNGSTDGPFVFTNLKPRFIMIKRTDSTSNWTILDTAREGYNVDNDPLYPNLSNAEGTTDLADILSNGFKLRSTDTSVNANAGTYIYACFSSNPFKNSTAV